MPLMIKLNRNIMKVDLCLDNGHFITVINRLAGLVKNGFVIPILVNKRIRSYKLSEFAVNHEKEIKEAVG